jgi:predicted dehydrogenase
MILAHPRQGGLANITASKITTGSEDEVTISLHGSQGALRFNAMTPHWLEVYDARQGDQPLGGRRGWTQVDVGQRFPKPAASFPTPKASLGWIRAHVACLHHFLAEVAAGRPGPLGLAHGVYLQELLEACRLSASEQRWQSLPAS